MTLDIYPATELRSRQTGNITVNLDVRNLRDDVGLHTEFLAEISHLARDFLERCEAAGVTRPAIELKTETHIVTVLDNVEPF